MKHVGTRDDVKSLVVKEQIPFVRIQDFKGVPGTDATSAIQQALNTGKTLFIDDVFLTSGNKVPSGTHIVFIGKGLLKLTDGANRPVLQNTNWKKSTWGGSKWGLDSNITIEGLNIDGNQANQVHHLTTGEYAGEYVSGVRLFGITNLTLTRSKIRHARTFAVWLAAIDGGVVDKMFFDQYVAGTPDNQDGLHINGPARNVFIRDLSGRTNDDLLALNADDGPLGANVPAGDITDIVVDGVAGIDALNGIRMLSATSKIDRIEIANIIGSYRDPAINLSAYGRGVGNFGTIDIDKVNVVCKNGLHGPGSDYYGVIVLDDKIDGVNISNVTRTNAEDDRPLVDVRPGANIGVLTIDGVTQRTSNTAVATETMVSVGGAVEVLNMSRITQSRATAVNRGGRLVQVSNTGTVGQLNGNQWRTKRLGNVVEVNGTCDPVRLTDVLDADSTPGAAVVRLSNGRYNGLYLSNVRTDPGRAVAMVDSGSNIWMGSSIETPSGASAFMGGPQIIGPGAYTILPMNSVIYDRSSEFNPSTFQFTNTVGQGMYDITVMVGVQVPPANTTLVVAIYRNGVAFRYPLGEAHNANCNLTTSVRLMLALGDVIDIRMYASNTATVSAGQDRSTVTIDRLK